MANMEKGVYFIQRDSGNTLIPCSPNKLFFSELTTVRPGKRYLPVGFPTVAKTNGKKALTLSITKMKDYSGSYGKPVLIDIQTAFKLLAACYKKPEFEDDDDNDQRANLAILEHLSNQSVNLHERGEVWLVAAKGRDVVRVRKDGRFSNARQKQQADIASQNAQNIPALLMMRQNGNEVQVGATCLSGGPSSSLHQRRHIRLLRPKLPAKTAPQKPNRPQFNFAIGEW